jgi:branched-subunit amino acid transport protein
MDDQNPHSAKFVPRTLKNIAIAVLGAVAIVGAVLARFAIPIEWNVIGFIAVMVAGCLIWLLCRNGKVAFPQISGHFR